MKLTPPTLTPPHGYSIISNKRTRSNTRVLEILIDAPGEKLPDRRQLTGVWQDLQIQLRLPLVANYYLPGMPIDKTAWATVRQDSDGKKMKVKIRRASTER